jgi:hypothetical protein
MYCRLPNLPTTNYGVTEYVGWNGVPAGETTYKV